MITKIFTGNSIDECLEKASKELDIKIENIKYEILEEKKSIFRKKATISVILDEVSNEDDGTVRIVGGKILVKNPKNEGKPAIIRPSKDINLIINGEKVNTAVEVYDYTVIDIEFDQTVSKRVMNISITPDKMKAYINIKYIPEIVYKLQDCDESREVNLIAEIKEKKLPPKYTKEEIIKELRNNNVVYGIKKGALEKCCSEEKIEHILIAEGIQVIDDIDDELDIKYNTNANKLVEDSTGKVDYKSIGRIVSVKKGDTLAFLKRGKQGRDGVDVTGKVIKHKKGKVIHLKAGEGCEIKDDVMVIALRDGKPSTKGTTFFVKQIHEVNGNVDLKTGNIKFNGDIIVYGAVMEGMKVEAGRDIEIYKNVADSYVVARGDVYLRANVINSDVAAGDEDVFRLKYIKNLKKFRELIDVLKDTCVQVKQHNLVGKKSKDGEIVKILIENKFKNITKLSNEILIQSLQCKQENNKLAYIVKQKLVGLGPLSIVSFDELDEMVKFIEKEIAVVSTKLTVPVNVYVYYCQDSNIDSSGSIYFTGKGEYVSNIIAHDGVYFESPQSIARGGVIKAGNEIRCKCVGSSGGVSTKLVIEKYGDIWADIAYQNTRFAIGLQEYILEKPARDIHAYLDKNGELTVDKFNL
ncbi:flagellar assembly protein A [Clostridium tepidiprofundi]|uniref:flagellar assembly protein A n=1 Tax=Clostridium tepidiprofundi TaxID=420412 RepID=UPI00137B519F|nr:flagellar assembly protein A [Clostridium tepidiprofundi]